MKKTTATKIELSEAYQHKNETCKEVAAIVGLTTIEVSVVYDAIMAKVFHDLLNKRTIFLPKIGLIIPFERKAGDTAYDNIRKKRIVCAQWPRIKYRKGLALIRHHRANHFAEILDAAQKSETDA